MEPAIYLVVDECRKLHAVLFILRLQLMYAPKIPDQLDGSLVELQVDLNAKLRCCNQGM